MRKIGEKPQVSRPKATRHLGYKVGPTLRNEGWGTRKGKSRSLACTPTGAEPAPIGDPASLRSSG